MKNNFVLFILIILHSLIYPQTVSEWDDTQLKNWPQQCKEIEIVSTLDNHIQPVYFYQAPGETPRPLIVSLHTWSGGYQQCDTLSWMCIDRGYQKNYRDQIQIIIFEGKHEMLPGVALDPVECD